MGVSGLRLKAVPRFGHEPAKAAIQGAGGRGVVMMGSLNHTISAKSRKKIAGSENTLTGLFYSCTIKNIMALTKSKIRVFLEKHRLKADQLSRMAGIKRWSLRRWLKFEKATITLRTANKLEDAMQNYDKP
jgi:hypothetical protein